jgi:hypothetical protein
MNFLTLSPHRAVVFDPYVTSGTKFLASFADPAQASELLGLTDTPMTGAGIKLIRGSIAESFKALTTINATFDVIVSAPPSNATIIAKGMPKPNVAAAPRPTGRRLFLAAEDDAVAAEEPTMDLGYAVFLMTNALLTPFGEACLLVNDASWDLISRDAFYSRVWHMAAHDSGGYKYIYIARDHKPLPGSQPGMLGRHAIRGSTVLRHTQSAQSLRKFGVVRDELTRRATLNEPDWNIYLDNNTVRVRYEPFLYETDVEIRTIADELDRIRGKTFVDLAVMRDTRDKVKGFLRHPKLKVPPKLVTAFDEICRQMQTLTAPFARPSPVQRVAWLDEQNGIECTTDFGPFKAGTSYPVKTRVFTGKKTELRHRPGHKQAEEVLVTGQEVLVDIYHKETYDNHAFTQFPLQDDVAQDMGDYWAVNLRHSLNDLLQHFKMPDVQCIAESDPTTYLKFTDRLRKLETA